MSARSGWRVLPRDVAVGARFVCGMPAFLRDKVGLEEARATVRRRLEQREAAFVGLVYRAVYSSPASPYRRLLDLAGCEYGDLEQLVHQDGLEGALRTLFRRGVYLTVDELKGRRPVVRGSATLAVNPGQLRAPGTPTHFLTQTGGSGGAPAPLRIDLAAVRDQAMYKRLILDAQDGDGWQQALWGVPGGWAIDHLFQYAVVGTPPVRWFSQVDPAAPGLDLRYRWSTRVMRWVSLLAGVRLPRPEYVSLEDPLPIALWMVETLRAGHIPHLITYASPAVRLCQAALDAGVDLRGVRITLQSEPVTAARLAVIRRTGAEPLPEYGTAECGFVAPGCLAPEAPDDLHLLHDLHAVIQADQEGEIEGLPAKALLFSSLRPRPRLLLLNVSMGDQAEVAQRPCGCPLERLGWTTHIHTIRSFEKLNAEGMTFLDADIVRALEEVLPARFGGGPTHYQLVEEETDEGLPRLRLLVHPSVGPLDPRAVADAFLAAIGGGSGAERVYELQWRQVDIVRVERRPPLATAVGKVLHLHRERRRLAVH